MFVQQSMIAGGELPLDVWLEMLLDDPDRRDIVTFMFPSDKHRNEYLDSICNRSESEVKKLLKSFLISSGSLKLRDETHIESLRSRILFRDILQIKSSIIPPNEHLDEREIRLKLRMERYKNNEDLIKELEKPEKIKEYLVNKRIELPEFINRLLDSDQDTWEGITWVLDLLPHNPQGAIDAVDAYITAHYMFLPSGRILGLEDVLSIIRARYIEYEHPIDLLLTLTDRDFEYLVGYLYQEMGYEVEVTQKSRDDGIDVKAQKIRSKEVIELALIDCKLYNKHNVGIKEVKCMDSTANKYRATKGVIVTSSDFTKPAKEHASEFPGRIELINSKRLMRMLNQTLGTHWIYHLDRYISKIKRKSL